MSKKVNRTNTPKMAAALRSKSSYEAFEDRRHRRERFAFTLALFALWTIAVLIWSQVR